MSPVVCRRINGVCIAVCLPFLIVNAVNGTWWAAGINLLAIMANAAAAITSARLENMRRAREEMALRLGIQQQHVVALKFKDGTYVSDVSALPKESSDQAIVAYRAWNWDGSHLLACGVSGTWAAMTAPRAEHTASDHMGNRPKCAAPKADCNCGYYAFKTPIDLARNSYGPNPRNPFHLVGRVALWGRVIECTGGYRAEYAYPQALFLGVGADDAAKAAARVYGVDCVPAPEEIARPYRALVEIEELREYAERGVVRHGLGQLLSPSMPAQQRCGGQRGMTDDEIRAFANDERAHRSKVALQWKGWHFPAPHEVAHILESGGKLNGESGGTDQGNQRPTQGNPYSNASNNARPGTIPYAAIANAPGAIVPYPGAHPGLGQISGQVVHQGISAGSAMIMNAKHYIGGY